MGYHQTKRRDILLLVYNACIYCRWGCSHECDAIKEYIASSFNSHDDLTVTEAGFFIDSTNC